jgi:hypothetical protein
MPSDCVRYLLTDRENGVHNEGTKGTKTNGEEQPLVVFVRLRLLRFFVVNSVFSFLFFTLERFVSGRVPRSEDARELGQAGECGQPADARHRAPHEHVR